MLGEEVGTVNLRFINLIAGMGLGMWGWAGHGGLQRLSHHSHENPFSWSPGQWFLLIWFCDPMSPSAVIGGS